MPDCDWPFDQPPNCAVITLRSIVFDRAPILHVTHDADDHGWQFLSGGVVNVDNASVVSLKEIVALDPTVMKVADLPPGWQAWRRSRNDPWVRGKQAATDLRG
jgi:hypothetical protein